MSDYAECEECGRNLPTNEMCPTGVCDDGEDVIQIWICQDCIGSTEPWNVDEVP